MAFPSVSVSETFSGTAGALGSPNWAATRQAGNGALAKDGSAHAKANVAGFCSNRWLPATFTETEAFVDLVTVPASGSEWVGIYARQQNTGSNDAYEIALDRTGTSTWQTQIFDKKSGVFTSRASDTTTTWAAGEKIGMRVRTVGATVVVEVYRYTAGAWVQTPLLTWTDSAGNRITAAGEVELEIQNTAARVSNFAVGTISTSATSNVAYDVRVTGTLGSNLPADARVTGEVVALQAYDARINGPLTNFAAQDVRLTGQATSSLATDARISGTNSTLVNADVRVSGVLSSSLATDARVTGTIPRKGFITWTEIQVPSAASATTQDVRINGQLSSNATATDVRIVGTTGSNTTVDVKTSGAGLPSSQAQDARLIGTAQSNVATDVRISGTNASNRAQDARVSGVTTSFAAQDVRISANDPRRNLVTWSEIEVPLAKATTERDARTGGTTTVSLAQDARIVGTTVTNTSQDVRINGFTTAARDTMFQWYGGAGKSGVIDSYCRMVIRTNAGIVYAFIVDDWGHQQGTPQKDFMLALKADGAPVGSTASEVGAAGRPIVPTAGDTLAPPDCRYDKNTGIVHLLYQWWRNSDNQQQLLYAQFSTLTDTWILKDEVVATSGLAFINHSWKRSFQAAALSLDSTGQPHVIYGTNAGAVSYVKRTGTNTWTAPASVSTGEQAPVHFNSMIDPVTGIQHVVFVRDSTNATSTIIRYTNRNGSTWLAPETVNEVPALEVTNFDQTPSVVIRESDGAVMVMYVVDAAADTGKFQRWRRRTGVNTWVTQGTGAATHAPGSYAKGPDIYNFEGHKISPIHPAYQVSFDGGTTFGTEKVFTPNGSNNQDGSASVRYDPLNETDPNIIDWLSWDEQNPDGDTNHFGIVYYTAVTPSRLPFEHDARITGTTSSNRTQDIRITGAQGSNTSYSTRLTAQALSNVTLDARITGQATATPRLALVTWAEIETPFSAPKTLANAYDVRLTGTASASLATDARITGTPNAISTTQDIRIFGDPQDFYSLTWRGTSASTSTVNVDTRVTAQLTSNTSQNVRVTGQLSSNDSVDVRINGTNASSDTADARLVGQTTSSTSQDVRISTLSLTSAQWDVRLVSQNSTLVTQDVRVTSEASSNVTRDIRVTGQAFTNVAADTRVTAEATNSTVANVTVTGANSSFTSWSGSIVGETTSNSIAYDVRIAGISLFTQTSQDVRVSGELPSNTSRNVRVSGASNPFTEVDVRIRGTKSTVVVKPHHKFIPQAQLVKNSLLPRIN